MRVCEYVCLSVCVGVCEYVCLSVCVCVCNSRADRERRNNSVPLLLPENPLG